MSVLDFIKFKICALKILRVSGAHSTYASVKVFSDSILDNLSNKHLSVPTEILIAYVANAKTPSILLKRLDDSVFFIKHIGNRALTQTQKEFAVELLNIMKRQREVLVLSFIRFWSQTGNVCALKQLLRHGKKLSHSLRSYLKHELASWEIYIYCSVRFPNSTRTYYYISDDDRMCIGDLVLVPVGQDNVLTSAEIVKIERYTYDSVPLPLRHTKKIHGRIN